MQKPLVGLTRTNLLRELTAGITLLAIAIPLNIGYAQIAGLPPTAGLYALIVPTVAAPLFFANGSVFSDAVKRAVLAAPEAAVQHLVIDMEAVTDVDVTGAEAFESLVSGSMRGASESASAACGPTPAPASSTSACSVTTPSTTPTARRSPRSKPEEAAWSHPPRSSSRRRPTESPRSRGSDHGARHR